MRYSNFHTHTVYSDGIDTMEEMIQEAIRLNFVSLGISDHSFTQGDTRYCMHTTAEQAYLREFRQLKEKYQDQIDLYIGLEYDGSDEREFVKDLDYTIGDCHYVYANKLWHSIDHEKNEQADAVERFWQNDYIWYTKTYMETYTRMVRERKPTILGHFDLTSKFALLDESDKRYRDICIEALDACLEVCPILELNTKAYIYPCARPFPAKFLLEECRRQGGQIMLASDCHDRRKLTLHFDDAIELLKSVGYKNVVTIHNGKIEEVPFD